MAYQGLGSVLKGQKDINSLIQESARKRAESKARGKSVAQNVVAIPAAAAAAYFGGPTAGMAAYQGAKGVVVGIQDAIDGQGPSQETMGNLMEGASGALSANQEIAAAKEAAKKTKQFNEMYKFLLG